VAAALRRERHVHVHLTVSMDIRGLITEIIRQSTYIGSFTLDELLRYSTGHNVGGFGISDSGDTTFMLVIADGEPEGALFVDAKGSLFGDKAVYQLKGSEQFRLYSAAVPIIDALVSRCRIYDRSHIKRGALTDIPTITTGTKQRIGVLCLTVVDRQIPVAGIHVSIRKGKLVLATDVTTSNGRVCFKLLNGRYTCVISDKTSDATRFVVDFSDAKHESVVDIGGKLHENK
jgi:hypothetical protein